MAGSEGGSDGVRAVCEPPSFRSKVRGGRLFGRAESVNGDAGIDSTLVLLSDPNSNSTY